MAITNPMAVFVKPWKSLTLQELGAHVRQLGFEWIEASSAPFAGCHCTV